MSESDDTLTVLKGLRDKDNSPADSTQCLTIALFMVGVALASGTGKLDTDTSELAHYFVRKGLQQGKNVKP